MSDISIPGVTSRVNSDKIIEEIMKLERVPLDRMENTRETLDNTKSYWQEINRKLTDFRDTSRTLYGVDNPFNERIVDSSNNASVTATATRNASEGTSSVKVISTAAADRFMSRSLDRDLTVPKGSYGFASGDKEITFDFGGGTLTEFAETVNKRGRGAIRAKVVQDTADTRVLLIESLQTGAENRLRFTEDSEQLGLNTGILMRDPASDYSFSLSRDAVRPWTESLPENLFTDDGLYFASDSEAFVPVRPRVTDTENLRLSVRYRVETLDPSEKADEVPPGPSVPEPGTADFGDITIQNNPSRTILPEAAPPEEPVVRNELTVFYAGTGDSQVPLPDIQGGEGAQELELPIGDYGESFTGLYIRNENTHRRITVDEITITDPTRRGEYVPANPITEASDAILELDGVTVRRSSNTIDDLIEGVTLNLREPSPRPVELDVRPDTEAVKNSIVSFVGHYNQLLVDIQVLTRDEQSIVDNLSYLSEEEREAYLEKLGTLQGDITLNQLKNRLQRIMMDPQPAAEGGDIVLLSEMGISTDASGPGGGINPNQLRGYLEINEKTLDSVLESRIDEVKKFFGRDANGDLVTDTGLAYTVEQNVTPYTRSGGIIVTRLRNIDQQIERTDDTIETVQERLERKEAELEQQYSRMEGALDELQRNSDALDNLNSQQGR